MVRPTYVDGNGMKKGAWTEEEDNKLRTYVQRYGHWNWRLLPKYAGLERCGKSCRLRWVNYLKPGTKHGNFSKHEVDLIVKLHDRLGNRWSAIAAELPGRTDNEIKNFWHTNIKKRGGSNVDAIQQQSMIEEQIYGKTDHALVIDEEEELPSPTNPISTTPQILDVSDYLDFSSSNVLLPCDSISPGSVAQSSDIWRPADQNSPASVAQYSSDICWPADSNSPASVAQYSSDIWWPADSNSPASVAQSSDDVWPQLSTLDDTSYMNQNNFTNFPPLQEEEVFDSGLMQEHYYREYLSSLGYSTPNSFDWNQAADDVLDTSQSDVTYFPSQVEDAGEIYDHRFQYFDHGMGLF